MGSLLSALKSGSGGGSSKVKGCLLSGQTSLTDQFPGAALNLEDPVSGLEDSALLRDMDDFVKRGRSLLAQLQNYKGSSEAIRKAITSPTPENEQAAYTSLSPMISLLRDSYVLSSEIESQIPNIIDALLKADNSSVDHSSAAILFAQIMDYTFQRIIHRIKNINENDPNHISSETTNQMSLFYAYHNPMIKTIIDKVLRTVDSSNKSKFLKQLSMLSSGAYTSGAVSASNKYLYARILMTCAILYDWISDTGVFISKSQIPILEVVSFIRKNVTEAHEAYLVSIQLGCKHFNDKETPNPVKKAFSSD
ncbi:hypothetical protein BB561_005052 [Smittium simulii]|uniref:CYRIA/CYRIB Rac1 binding domain-containing protein n=1 Tax=Smittium simulii TaxID=133385 RepID=A0A2T9YCE9_9FUNG|nr:hypothetical protein BB561_005052 [Smittium simulii]